ncbi:hypothetical protein A1E70_RS02385 [Acinetobacter baumannii]|nr:hypothetical protein [Acinetobacter baumannii]EHU1537235.1 hypothetical protein [Acinetobacter baumannii]EHU1999535.1 hypothetical protein [Acinetobacter baumannii]
MRSYEYINHPYNRNKKKELIGLIKISPLTFINIMWNGYSGGDLREYEILGGIERPSLIGNFNDFDYKRTKEIFSKSIENSIQFHSDGYILNNLEDYYLLDMYRDYENFDVKPENQIIKFNKRIEINIEEYFEQDEEHELLSQIVDNEIFKTTTKFHLDLQSAIDLEIRNKVQAQLDPNAVFISTFY